MKSPWLCIILPFLISLVHAQNNAIDFDGIDDRVIGPSSPAFELEDGTVDIWVRPQSKPTSQTFLCYRDATGFQTRYLWNFLGNLSGLGFWNGSAYSTLSHPFTSGQWVRLTFVDDGFETKAYVDGSLIGAFPIQFGIASGSDLNLVLGYDIPGSEYFLGQIDEIRIWNKVLTQSEIQDQTYCELSGASSCLVAYYQFNQGTSAGNNPSETVLTDNSGNGYDGFLENFTLSGSASNWVSSGTPLFNTCLIDNATCNVHYTVQPFYLITSDYSLSSDEYVAIVDAMIEIQAWYQVATGGKTFDLSNFGTPVVINLPNNAAYYEPDYWGRIIPDLAAAGYSPFSSGTVNLLWIKGGGGVALGAQGCGGNCGLAMVGMDLFPQFNTGQYFSCPNAPGGVAAFPCIPVGAAAHELGHCFGLPHPVDGPATSMDANHSLMQTHWNYPYTYAPGNESPWSLLTLERQTLLNNPFFLTDLDIIQPFEQVPILNLPVAGPMPIAGFSYSTNGLTVTFTNNSLGNDLNYWTFGESNVSNETEPVFTFPDYGNYTVRLRVSNSDAMMDMQETTISLSPPLPLELIGFSVSKKEKFNQLNWTTWNEIDFDQFEIEKSFDGTIWYTLGSVAAQGNHTEQRTEYTFKDELPGKRKSFYRLKMLDVDGSFQYSNVLVIYSASPEDLISLTPNPGNSFMKINADGDLKINTIRILNSIGEPMFVTYLDQNTIDVQSYPCGIYFIEITAFGNKTIKKFIKSR